MIKKLHLALALACAALSAAAQQVPVAVLSANERGNKTLEFTYGNAAEATATRGADGTYLVNYEGAYPEWFDSSSQIDSVVFTKEFAKAKPGKTDYWFAGCNHLKKFTGLENFNTSEVVSMEYMFMSCMALDSLDLSTFDTKKVTNMEGMFQNCANMKSINVSNFNTAAVTNVKSMFMGCKSLTKLDISSFNFTGVQRASSTRNSYFDWFLANCTGITELNVGNNSFTGQTNNHILQYVGSATSPCKLLVGEAFDKSVLGAKKGDYYQWLGGFFTEPELNKPVMKEPVPVAILSTNARGNKTLTFTIGEKSEATASGEQDGMYLITYGTFPNWFLNTYKVDSVVFMPEFADARPIATHYWLASASKLKRIVGIQYLNTSSVVNMHNMFAGCSSLEEVDLSHFETSSVLSMSQMFFRCSSLKNIDMSSFTTTSLRTALSMFAGCSALEKVDISGFDLRSISPSTAVGSGINRMFQGCSALKEVNVGGNTMPLALPADSVFGGVGTAAQPCLLQVSDSFSKSVLGTPSNGVYHWLSGYFTIKPTGVEGIKANDNATVVARYNLQGQRVASDARGVSIVKLSDGTTRKEIVR